MADHSSVQEAETAAANKAREIAEAAIRLTLQKQQQQRPEDTKLYKDFYRAYRDKGVDDKTAKSAAADMAAGFGAKDSEAVRQAEAQVVQRAQQAQEYRTVVKTAADRSKPMAERRQALDRTDQLETQLGIKGQTAEAKAQVINQLDAPAKQIEAAPKDNPVAKAALLLDQQKAYEKEGASPKTAKAASREVVDQALGAADGAAVKQAHQEIRQHQLLKEMYQGVYEKNGVSPELAAKAADQLARGNGANRSKAVRQAHAQALSEVKQAQNTSPEQSSQSTESKPVVNRSPEASQQASPQPTPQIQAEQSAPKPEAQQQTTEASSVQSTPSNEATTAQSESLWQQHSPTEQGKQLRPEVNYEDNAVLNDAHFAYNALSTGATTAEVKDSILRNSPEANSMEAQKASNYADRVISRAEQARDQTTAPTKATVAQPQPSATALQSPTPAAVSPQSEQPQVAQPKLDSKAIYNQFSESKASGVFATMAKKDVRTNDMAIASRALEAGYSPVEVKAVIAQNSPHAKSLRGPDTYGARTVEKAQATDSFSKQAPDVIWKQTQASSGQTNKTDKAIVHSALKAGYNPEHIGKAISKNSPTAQQSADASQYGKGVVKEVQEEIKEEKQSNQSGKKAEKGQATDQKREKSASKKVAQSKQTKPSTKNITGKRKVRSKSKGQGMEM
ncbi:hypothetical protein S7335_1068 [Synechococcus sp. PCC 7335]|uniref:hypothetical protein n=1 Tax=Synechococcus sp. (strain ATCC 29403 / PCC 7335) TaxID=91464 RepID=UPI00017ECB7D|nr:hypothetical protein [Synechococcus sp. PCC 7335]EDX82765.1 hypothetical protein S7335_1068 [Synechococcus sp. PCC 7335]